MALIRKPGVSGLSDPSIVRQAEANLAQSSLIARGKPSIVNSSLVLPSTTVAATGNTVIATTSTTNQSADTVTVYETNGSVYVSSIDQTINRNVINNPIAGVGKIIAGNNITITSTNNDGTGNVTINSTASGGNGSPGGSNTQVQFNDAGVFDGNTGFTFNKTTGIFTAPFLSGNGNGLSNIQGANVSGFVPNANVANTAFAVAAANVSGLGNIATTNYDGNASNVLHGDGTWSADTTTYGNSNVVTLLSAFGSNTITTTGNVSVGNITATNLGNIVSANLDGNVSNLLTGNGTYVAIPVVPTVGNIATLNLDGSNSNVLYGNGVFAAVAGGGANTGNVTFNDINIIGTGNLKLQPDSADSESLDIYLTGANDIHISGSGNIILGTDEQANVAVLTNGNVAIQAGNVAGTKTWTFDTSGDLTLPGSLKFPSNYSIGPGEGSLAILSPDNVAIIADQGNTDQLWLFGADGTTRFPTLTVDLHNGGNQTAQTLQFGNPGQQAIITGPTPEENYSAERIIIQGQRGNGTGEGGDVYVWGGDADTNGGDIKIYAGDADNVSTGSGGYVNLAGGDGFDNGGAIDITGGHGNTDGGAVNIQGGYGETGQGGTIGIYGGGAPLQGSYGNVQISSGTHAWLFDNSGNLTLPDNTFAVNYANGDQVSIGGGNTDWANIGNINNANGPTQIAIGANAGLTDQSSYAVAVGASAGSNNQGYGGVAVGYGAGATGQGTDATAIGTDAGGIDQGGDAVAVGESAGSNAQGSGAVAVGNYAGSSAQGDFAVAIGADAGQYTQGAGAVAIGDNAGETSQGVNAIAIGVNAGRTSQGNNSIILNATGANLDQTTADTFTVKPVRQANTANAMYYDASTGEITYDTAGGGSGVSIVPNDVTYTDGSLYGNTNPGFTVVAGHDDDDDAYSIPVDFPIEFLGNSYSAGNVFLVSNSYLTFGPTSYTDYHPVGPVVIPVPAIFVGAMDLSNQKYYYGYAADTDIFVIGYEGSINTGGQEDYPAIKWELQVSAATPDQIIIVVDGPADNGGALNFPAGVWGISDGAVWIDQFQPLPWYSNTNDDTYNSITIAPVTPVAVSTIAFTGPGVTYGTNGGTTFINIDPFDQAISVGYDGSEGGGDAILSSVYGELTLTTDAAGDDLNLRPLGNVNIAGGSRSDNQPGHGYDVNIYGGNAHDVPSSPGQNYNGGDVEISGGDAVNAGTPGDVKIISNGNTWTFAPTGNLTLPSNTSSINYANGSPYGGGGANTGNVTFNDINIIGTGNLKLQPDSANASAYLDIFLTAGPDIHIAGNGETVILGTDDYANVTVNVNGNVSIQANAGTPQTWNFNANGTTTFPNNTINPGNGIPIGIFTQSGNAYTQINQYPNNWEVYSEDDTTAANSGYAWIRAELLTVDTPEVFIENKKGIDGVAHRWTFDADGNLTLPANTVAINFANGSSAFGNIVATNLDSSSSNVLFGNGVFAAVPAPTVAQDITSTGAMSIMLYDGNIKYNNYATVEPSSGNIAGGNISANGNISGGNISATGNITGAYFIGNGSQLTDVGVASVPSQNILPTIQSITISATSNGGGGGGSGWANVTVANTIPVTEYGVIVTAGTISQKYVTGSLGSIPGTVQLNITTGLNTTPFTVYAYVTSNAGTYYSNSATGTSGICLLAGTQIALSDGSYKAIEDITYTDKMLSWDFDRGCYAETLALWIKRGETGSQYNLLTFSDGTTLRTFDQHRIFNKQAGAFTYPMTDATPIGTITVNEHGKEITLTNKQVIQDTIEYYNVITDYHMNLFSDSVLTSCRFNNIYPIIDMKFVKDARTLRTRDEFENVEDRFFNGLRLAEQTTDIETVEWYVNRLISTEVLTQSELTV